MTLTGNQTNYYIARKNTNTNEDSVLRMNSFSGLFSSVNDFDGATKYETFDQVKQNVTLHNMLADFNNQPYEYYAIKHDTDSVRLDEDGNVVEDVEEPEEETPDEPTE